MSQQQSPQIHIHLHGAMSPDPVHVHVHFDDSLTHRPSSRRRPQRRSLETTNLHQQSPYTTPPTTTLPTTSTTEPLTTTINDLFRLFLPSASSTLSTSTLSSTSSTPARSSLLNRIFDDPSTDGIFRFYYTSLDNPTSLATNPQTSLPTIQELSRHTEYDVIETEDHPLTCEECSICKIAYQEKDIVRKLKSCQHCFHIDCVDKWFEKSRCCPLCRCDIATSVSTATTTTSSPAQETEETMDEIDQLLDNILQHE